jgi:hypothetical protein
VAKGVSQGMGVEVVAIRDRRHGDAEHATDGPVAEATAALVQKQRFMIRPVAPTPRRTHRHPCGQRRRGPAAEGHQALFAALAPHAQKPLVQAQIGEVDGHQLADPQTGAIQEFSECAVTDPGGCIGKRLHQFFDHVQRYHRRRSTTASGMRHRFGRAVPEYVLGDQKAEIRPQHRQCTFGGSGRQPLGVEVRQEGPDVGRSNVGGLGGVDLPDEKLHGASDLPAVGHECRSRQIPLPLEMTLEILDQPDGLINRHESSGWGGRSPRRARHHRPITERSMSRL